MTNGASLSVAITGIDEMRAKLKAIPAKLRKQSLRNALAAGARIIRDDARTTVPILRAPTKTRNVGTVRKAISVRTSKAARRSGNVGVFVNVRPAKLAARGKNSPNDPFYWRWLEFGARHMQGAKYLTRAAGKLPQALQVFKSKLSLALAKINTGGEP